MEHYELLQKENKILKFLSGLPRRITQMQDTENVTEFVFHDLCNKECFDFDRAAFFIDNPDFHCTRGIAGFDRSQAFTMANDIWQESDKFTHHMQASAFNILVRSLKHSRTTTIIDDQQELAGALAHDLGFKNYAFCTWNMRYHNRGFVVYERSKECDVATQETILDGLSFLSFCPLF